MPISDALFRFLRSLRLTIILVVLFIVCIVYDSFFPQVKILRSYFFLGIIVLLFINLLICTLYRFLINIGRSKNRNFGPDVLHGALLLFIIGACISGFLRIDFMIWLLEGEYMDLPGGSVLIAEDLSVELYEDGRVKEWISTVTVVKNNQILAEQYLLRVNHPLKVDGITLYQNSWGTTDGKDYTVIQAVYDPGLLIIITSMVIAGFGIFMTLYTKLIRQQRKEL